MPHDLSNERETMLAYKLIPQSAFHFGIHSLGNGYTREYCPSDTLYAALFIEALRAGYSFFTPSSGASDTTALDPPLLLSSCFPYVGTVPLLPRPRLWPPQPHLAEWRSQFQQLAYVSPTIFQLMIDGAQTTLTTYLHERGRLAMGGTVWIAHEDGTVPAEPFWQITSPTRLIIDRGNPTSSTFQVGQVSFAPECGLYLICQERHAAAAANLGELLERLGDSGLGGRRSYGLGQFRVAAATAPPLPHVPTPQRLVLLSRYRPTRAELAEDILGIGASYELIQIGGWSQGTPNATVQRRSSLRMISEGSVVRTLASGALPIGSICDLRPNDNLARFPNPIWRYGLAFGVGIGA